MNSPLLSIIIVSYNTQELTLNCLQSIYRDKKIIKDYSAEIIVVDNNSADNTTAAIKTKFPQVKIIQNQKNTGFAMANNQGITAATGNYVLLLNSDTLILHSAISQSLDWLASHPEIHICTAQLLNPDKTIQASGGFFPNLLNLFTWTFGLDDLPLVNLLIKPIHPHTPTFYLHDTFFQKDHFQDWITGAFFLIRASTLKLLKGFNTDYFMYGEELELCYRNQKLFPQSRCAYLIGPQVIHFGGASAQVKTDPIIREIQGIQSFFQKHRPKWQYPLAKFMLFVNPSIRLRGLYYKLRHHPLANFYSQLCSQL